MFAIFALSTFSVYYSAPVGPSPQASDFIKQN